MYYCSSPIEVLVSAPFFFFFGLGKGGECIMHCSTCAPCVGLWYGLPMDHYACWTDCHLTYPLKPSHAGGAQPHPFLCEID